MRVLYIAGLSRSGSTFLERLLASHPEIVTLGEINQVLKRIEIGQIEEISGEICDCGARVSECEFWGNLIDQKKESKLELTHIEVLKRFEKIFPEKILLDCSKEMPYLKKNYLEVSDEYYKKIQLKILLLIRDFRGWALSIGKNRRKDGEIDYGYIFNSYLWFRWTLLTYRFLKRTRLDFFVLLYERIVFQFTESIKQIDKFIDLRNDIEMLDMRYAVSHEIYGNEMRKDHGRRNQILYDDEWIRDWKPIVFQPIVLPVWAMSYYLYKKFS